MTQVWLNEESVKEIKSVLSLSKTIYSKFGLGDAEIDFMVQRLGDGKPISGKDAKTCIKIFDKSAAIINTWDAIKQMDREKRDLFERTRLNIFKYKAVMLAQIASDDAKIAYRKDKKFTPERKELLGKIIKIVTEYKNAGYKMTLRQLYYQLVARDVLANIPTNYGKLSDLLTDARMTGMVDWNFIEDRVRVPKIHAEFESVQNLMDAAIYSYRRPRWEDQDNYVEVWVEKDALSGVLSPITDEYHVRLMVNRGYSSVSAMHDAAMRFIAAEQRGKTCKLIYFGDHDPSGEDMVNDINKRLSEFWANVEVEKIALTMEQIEQYEPPPNPAKQTDSRYEAYAAKHGEESWELDALPPDVLEEILRNALDAVIDKEKYDKVIETEDTEKAKLKEFSDKFYSGDKNETNA